MRGGEKLAYLAGVFDGEGCVGAYPHRRAPASERVRYIVTVQVGQSLPGLSVIQQFHKKFGGKIDEIKHPQGKATCYRWTARGQRAAVALRELLPFLQVKRTQAQLAIRVAKLQAKHGPTAKHGGYKPRIWDQLTSLSKRIKWEKRKHWSI